MFGSVVLEVAIGLAYLYLLLSLACMAINEWIAGGLALRSKTLEAGIRNLLDDPQGTGLASKFFKHPLIQALTGPDGRLPSYISSRAFATALLDVVIPADPAGPRSVDQVRTLIAQLPPGRARDVLLPLLNQAGNDLAQARHNVETWYNDTMDRVSGWYKRRANLIVACLALGITFVFNADTLTIANSLARSPAVAASVAAAARTEAGQPMPSGEQLPAVQSALKMLQVPIGWSLDRNNPRALPAATDYGGWIAKLLGLLFTSIAVSLGAPFWFDFLGKVVNLRSSGAPPD